MKPFVLENSMLTMNDVFYPKGYLVVMFEKADDAKAVAEKLEAAAIDMSEAMLVSPEAVLEKIFPTTEDVDDVLPSPGSEGGTARRFAQLARQGHTMLMVPAKSNDAAALAMDVIRQVPFSIAEKYSTFIIEDME